MARSTSGRTCMHCSDPPVMVRVVATGSSVSIAVNPNPTDSRFFHTVMMRTGPELTSGDLLDDNNTGSVVAVGRAAVCLTLAIAASSLTVMVLEVLLNKSVTLKHEINALTIGFAAISSNILTCEPWAALLCGFAAGLIYVGGRRGLRKLGDNDVFTIHGLGGVWGLIFTGCLAKPKFIRDVIGANFYPARLAVSAILGDEPGSIVGVTSWTRHSGVFYPTGRNGKSGHSNGKLLAVMILEGVIIFAWGFVMAVPVFVVLKAVKKLKAADSGYAVSKTDA